MSNMTTPVQNKNMNWNTCPSLGTKFFLVFVSSNLETLHMTRKNLLLAAWYRQYTRACEYDPKKNPYALFPARSVPIQECSSTLLNTSSLQKLLYCSNPFNRNFGGSAVIFLLILIKTLLEQITRVSHPPPLGALKLHWLQDWPSPNLGRCAALLPTVRSNGTRVRHRCLEIMRLSFKTLKKATHTHQTLKHKSRFVNFCFGCALDLFARRACGLSFIPSPYPTHRPAMVVTTPPLIFWTRSLPVSLDSRSHHGI